MDMGNTTACEGSEGWDSERTCATEMKYRGYPRGAGIVYYITLFIVSHITWCFYPDPVNSV